VRKIPASRAHPRFAGPALAAALAAAGIGYEHLPALGGRRARQAGVRPATNALWRSRSFQHYADWALGDEFQAGLARLRALGHRRRCAVLCAEAVWWRCHRRIIADHLLAKGETVLHIMSPGRADPEKRTPGSRLRAGRLTYPSRP
jgi:uncharacterized protein (DUF488 family)